MKFNLGLLLPLLVTVSTALPAPLKAEYNQALKNPSLGELYRQHHIIKSTNDRANGMLSKMQRIAQNPNDPHHNRVLRTCFGDRYRNVLQLIQHKIGDMVTGTYYVKATLAIPPAHNAYASWVTPHTERAFMEFYPSFYQMSDHNRALALIHETSHALARTRDIFNYDYTPSGFLNRFEASFHNKRVYLGYLEHDFRHIRENASPGAMILNADSWYLFAHLAESGFRDIDGTPMVYWGLHDNPPKPPVGPPPVVDGSMIGRTHF